jgi:hypothetical protein
MATDAFIVLKQLRCLQEHERGSEPYLWPVLLYIDDHTLDMDNPGEPPVAVIAPAINHARVVLQSGMRAGETAAIPPEVGHLRVRFEDGLTIQKLIVAVALWEEDETPTAAMRAGFAAFVGAQRAALIANLSDLFQATTEAQLQLINDKITDQVRGAVESAIKNGLTGWQKAKVFAGTLNLDDFIASASVAFPLGLPPEPGELVPFLVPTPFTLPLVRRAINPLTGEVLDSTTDRYELEGELLLRRVPTELCRAEVAQVAAAKVAVEDIEKQIKALQAEREQASPAEKVLINQQIKELKEVDLPAKEAELTAARQALQACRDRWQRFIDNLQDFGQQLEPLTAETPRRERGGPRLEGSGQNRPNYEPPGP